MLDALGAAEALVAGCAAQDVLAASKSHPKGVNGDGGRKGWISGFSLI